MAELERAAGGRTPKFSGSGPLIHDRVREEMRRVYMDNDNPAFLDATGRDLLAEGRRNFRRFNLGDQPLLSQGRAIYLFPWAGDRILNTLALQFRAREAQVMLDSPALLLANASPDGVAQQIEELTTAGPLDGCVLAASVENKRTEKHHSYLSEGLLCADYTSSQIDPHGAWQVLERLKASLPN